MLLCYIHTLQSHLPCADVMGSCESFRTEYTLHHAEFPHGTILLSTDRPYRASECEFTGDSSRLYRKDSSMKSS
jgi:hypothetical protein